MLIAENISIKYIEESLFEGVNITFSGKDKERIAIVGRNGCGKSSLLKILMTEIKPSTGTVSSYGEKIGYIPQEVSFGSCELVVEYLESGIEEEWMTYKIDIALESVGLSQKYLIKETKFLSGGEKIKVALAYTLLCEPTILLLDEPTNNLDVEGVDWLEGFIRRFNGSIVMISHDRYLINRAIKEIWELSVEEKNMIVYTGNYDDFLVQRKAMFEKRMHDYLASKKKIDSMERWITANENPLKFTNILAQRKKALERMQKIASARPLADPKIKIGNLSGVEEGRMLVADIKEKRFGDRVLLNNILLKVYNEDRVLITGPNGSGKTTLLNIVAGIDTDFIGTVDGCGKSKIGFMKQFSDLDSGKRVLEEFMERSNVIEEKARAILSNYLFDSKKVTDLVSNLSYGELRRLDLAIILSHKPNLLILDEPTNHLDIFAREELENFIMAQEIPMLIVSHDRYFVEKIGVNKVLNLGE